MDKVTFIIPVYNVEAYLPKCLDSIINQTYQNIEIICVDDGSSDNSLKILNDYAAKDKRIKVFTQANQGVSIARNIGIDEAKGNYISFVDSDDFIAPDFCEKMLAAALASGAEVVQSGYYVYDDKVTKTKQYDSCIVSDFIDVIKNYHCVYIWNKLYKTAFIRKNNLKFFPVRITQDALFSMMVAHYVSKFEVIDYVGYYYCVNPTSVTQNPKRRDEFIKCKYLVFQKIMDFLKPYHSQEEIDAVSDFLIAVHLPSNMLENKEIFEQHRNIFGNHELLLKKRRRAVRRRYFNLLIRKKIIVIFGYRFCWGNLWNKLRRLVLKKNID